MKQNSSNMELILLYKKSISHYKRMIKYAKRRPEGVPPELREMLASIGEDWRGMYCSFCIHFKSKCCNCDFSIDDDCPDDWYNMDCSRTWEDWTYYAEKLLKKMEDRLQELENERDNN